METETDIIERFSRLTHSPRGKYAAGDETYRQLLNLMPESDRPVVGKDAMKCRKLHWNTAASIVFVVGIGIAIAGVYTYRNNLFTSDIPSVESASPEAVRPLVFDNVPLCDIISTLQKYYDAEIYIADTSITDYRITATFNSDEPISEILSILCEVSGFHLEQSEGRYMIHAAQ